MKRILIHIILFFCLSSIISFAQIESESFLENASVTAIDEEPGYIWVATYGQGVFRYSKKDEKWVNFSTKNNNLENDLFYNIAVSKDYVWAGASEGLFIYDKKRDQWRKRKFALGGEFGNWIRSLKYDEAENVLWIGRFRNLTHLDVKRQRYTDYDRTQNNDASTNNFTCIGLDGDSVVWFGTEGGVHRYIKKMDINDKNAWQFINNKKGFNNDGEAVSISDFIFERDYVWFATDEFVTPQQPEFNLGGIYRYNRRLNWDRLSKSNGLPANGIYSLVRTGNKIWASVYSFDKKAKKEYGKGLVLIDRFDGSINTIDLNMTEMKSATIQTLYFDGTFMWVGTEKGLHRIRVDNPLAAWTLKKENTVEKKSDKKIKN